MDTAPTEIYTLSLHDALPIYPALTGVAAGTLPDKLSLLWSFKTGGPVKSSAAIVGGRGRFYRSARLEADRKSTRLNSSHITISYAVFCLKKKKKKEHNTQKQE